MMPPAEPKHNWKFFCRFFSFSIRSARETLVGERKFQHTQVKSHKVFPWAVVVRLRRLSGKAEALRRWSFSDVQSHIASPEVTITLQVISLSCRMSARWKRNVFERRLLSSHQHRIAVAPCDGTNTSVAIGKIIFRIIENKGNWMINTMMIRKW